MDTFEMFVRDFEDLEHEHTFAAKNEHIFALGSEDSDIAYMHEEAAEMHRNLAELYKKIKDNPTKFMQLMEEF